MLQELKVRDLAIIQSVEINFGEGLNVITGETGAGKSILLAALNLILGGRSDRELIRTGSEEAWVEASFSCNPKAADLLKEFDIQVDDGELITLRRVIGTNGRSRGYVNCVTVPASLMKQLAPFLIDFGRQHEQGVLMDPERHIELLDRYAEAQQQRMAVEKAHQKVTSLEKEQKRLIDQKKARRERVEFLGFQKKTILDVNPQKDEEEELTKELEKLNSIEQCRDLAKKSEYDLYNRQNSVHECLSEIVSSVEELVELDDSLSHVLEDLNNSLIAVEEAARSLHSYQRTISASPEEVREVQERLDQVIELQQRYGGSHESVMQRLKEIDEELKEIAQQDKRAEMIGKEIDAAKIKLKSLALKLSEQRKKAASTLGASLKHELADLAMENTQFEIGIIPVETLENVSLVTVKEQGETHKVAAWGMESVNFLFSANKGEELRSLEKVASGGELSRIMLALKRITGESFSVSCFVFDEIDSGISGKVSGMVAKKLRQIVSSKKELQVICISHTPQVAAAADHHFRVEKQIHDGRTKTRVQALSSEESVEEVSRIIAGDQSKEQALALAQELIKKSRK